MLLKLIIYWIVKLSVVNLSDCAEMLRFIKLHKTLDKVSKGFNVVLNSLFTISLSSKQYETPWAGPKRTMNVIITRHYCHKGRKGVKV